MEALRTLTAIEDPAELLAGVEDFLKKYPQSRYRISALMVGLGAAAEVDPTSASVVDYAERYIEAYSAQGGVAIAYAFAARIMQAANAWPDKVDEYMEKALSGEGGVRGGDRGRAQIFDTAAFINGARDNIEEAIRFEEEALELDPTNPTFQVSLAGYLVKAGRLDEAENQLMGPLLQNPDNQAAQETFDELASRKAGGSMSVQAYKEAAIGRGADRMLAEAEDPVQEKQNLAVAFAKLQVLTNRALTYALEIEQEIGPDRGADAYVAARLAIAQVYLATENYQRTLEALEPVVTLASPYAYDFHLTRGKALEELGREEEAINAYLASASAVANPAIMQPLEVLWEKVYGSEKDLEETLEELGEELESWHPTGQFLPSSDWSGRIVLAELFTGSECPPCVASDIAYDGLIEYYPLSVTAVLVYHEHIPGPDPMTNPDTEARMAYYTRDVVRGTPTSIINGLDHSVGGGGRAAAKGRYGIYSCWRVHQRSISTSPESAPARR